MKQLMNFIEHLKGIHLPDMESGLVAQLNGYMQSVVALERKRGGDVSGAGERKKLAMLYFKLWQFMYSREERAHDSTSPEVVEAERIKGQLFPLGIPRLALCVDGRVLSKLVAGLHEGVFRTPAGDNSEFVPHREENSIFLEHGAFAEFLDRHFRFHDSVVTVLDSHLHCAARKAVETERAGIAPPDDGLYRDVVRKKSMGTAITEYVSGRYGEKKNILSIQISFDPHRGTCFMGLEKDECLNHPDAMREGYTETVIETLVSEGSILSTGRFLRPESPVRQAMARHYFDINYETDYRRSTVRFWEEMDRMADEVAPIIEELLLVAYPELGVPSRESELRERALVLLANAYNAFLHNYDAAGKAKPYPYDQHDESVVTVTYGDRGPYDRARSFSVDPHNPDLSYVVRFTAGLIRANREAKRYSITETEALQACYGENIAGYSRNPVPVFFFERVETMPDADIVERLRQADWSDIVDRDWMSMDDQQFERYLDRKVPNIPAVVSRRINALRTRAVDLFQPGHAATEDLLEGRLTPVWALSAPDRRTLALFPFMAKGYGQRR